LRFLIDRFLEHFFNKYFSIDIILMKFVSGSNPYLETLKKFKREIPQKMRADQCFDRLIKIYSIKSIYRATSI